MHRGTTVGAALLTTFVFAGALTSAALAALPEFLPGVVETTIKGSSGKTAKQTEGGGTVKCEKDKPLGHLVNPKLVFYDIHYEGCKQMGFGANSVGDSVGVILEKGLGTICYLSKAAKTVGVAVEISPTLQIEVPTAKQKSEVKGVVIAEVKPVNTSRLTGEVVFTQKEGKPGITKCEGAAASVLLIKEAEKEFKPAGEEGTESLEFGEAVEVMA